MAVQGPAQHDVAIVAGHRAAHLHRVGGAATAQTPDAVGVVVLPVHDAAVPGQLIRRLRRAVRLQIGGRGAQEAPVRHDSARRQARVGQVAEADAQVIRLFDQVDGAVRQLQLHFQLRVAQGELRQQGRDHRAPEAQGGVDAQQTLRFGAAAGQRFFHGADVVEDLPRLLQIAFAVARQADAPRAAVEQAHAQALFHQHQSLADGGRRDAQLARRGRQAAQLGQQHKESHFRGGVAFHYEL